METRLVADFHPRAYGGCTQLSRGRDCYVQPVPRRACSRRGPLFPFPFCIGPRLHADVPWPEQSGNWLWSRGWWIIQRTRSSFPQGSWPSCTLLCLCLLYTTIPVLPTARFDTAILRQKSSFARRNRITIFFITSKNDLKNVFILYFSGHSQKIFIIRVAWSKNCQKIWEKALKIYSKFNKFATLQTSPRCTRLDGADDPREIFRFIDRQSA